MSIFEDMLKGEGSFEPKDYLEFLFAIGGVEAISGLAEAGGLKRKLPVDSSPIVESTRSL